jgi:hypothetical protein
MSPLCSLWEDQRTGGVSTYDHPRGPLVRAFMDDLKRARTELRRAAYEDRAIKNLKDSYNFDESRKFSEVFLNGQRERGVGKNLSDPHRSAIDACNDALKRDDAVRELSDLRLDNEGPHCLAVIQQITHGKTVRREDGGDNRKTNYHGYLRHRDVLACPVGYRWRSRSVVHVPLGSGRRDAARLQGPSFVVREEANSSITGEPEVEISHSTQGAWINRVFAVVGIFVSAPLHAPRKAVAGTAVGSGICPLPI